MQVAGLEGRVGFGPTTSRLEGELNSSVVAQAWTVDEIVGSYLVFQGCRVIVSWVVGAGSAGGHTPDLDPGPGMFPTRGQDSSLFGAIY
jgi:hypothetical protein